MLKRGWIARRFSFALVLAGAAVGTAAHAQGRAADACAERADVFACRQRHEQGALDRWPARVIREPGKLTLRLDNGRALVLEDRTVPGADTVAEKPISFVFRDFVPAIGFYVVELGYDRGDAFMLVDARNGKETAMRGEPFVAPGGRRIVEASAASDSGLSPGQITVWRLDAAGPVQEWTYSPPASDAWDPVDPVWTSATTIRFTRRQADRAGLSQREWAMLLRLTPGGWQMAPAR
jgi:hypothetical protein